MKRLGLLVAMLLSSGVAAGDAAMEPGRRHEGGAPAVAASPERATDADGHDAVQTADDVRAQARQDAWQAYQHAVVDALRASADPHERTLAELIASVSASVRDPAAAAARDARLLTAAQAAPDDAGALWLALLNASADATLQSSAFDNLQRLEPDNGALWLVAMNRRRDDADAVDAALRHMAAAKTFDLHYAELLSALQRAYLRAPVPAGYLQALADSGEPSGAAQEIALTAAMSVATASAVPGFQPLVHACRIDPEDAPQAGRAGDCAAIGRLLARHSDTLIGRRIGYAVLRVSRTYGEDDVRRARTDDWIVAQDISLLQGMDAAAQASLARMTVEDWMQTHSELEAMRRAVARAGMALQPPVDWSDAYSPFADQRLRADREAMRAMASAPGAD